MSSRFGFVTFDDIATAKKAQSEFDGHEVDGYNIGLRFAEDRPREGGSAGRGGRGGGGFGGGGFGRGRGGGRGMAIIVSVCVYCFLWMV